MTRESNSRGRSRDDDRPARGRDRDEERPSSRRNRDDEDDAPRGRGRSNFEYHSRSAADTKKRASMGANDFDKILVEGVKMWKPNDGDNTIRILPPTWKKPDHFGLDVYVHYGVGPDRQSYLCLNKMKGEPDPIAEAREEFRRTMDPDDKDDQKYLKDMDAKRRVLVYLIDRANEKEGVQAWAMPWTVDRDIVKVSQDKSTGEVLMIDHPEDGYDVMFEKKGAKDRTEYLGISIARRSSPLGKDSWLDFAIDNPLPDQLNYFEYDHIAKAFNGGSSGSGRKSADRDDEAPRGRGDRDRNDRPNARGRDDDDERPRQRTGRDSEDDDAPPSRGRGGSSRAKEPEGPTWDSIHEMTGRELEDLIDEHTLDIDPDEAKNDEDLADWVCEEMGIEKPAPKRSSARTRVKDDEDDPEDRLSRMRRSRGD